MRLFVGNLSFSTPREDVIDLFSSIGAVDEKQTTMPLDRETNRPRGFAFVEMPNIAEAKEAVDRLHGYSLDGRAINVSEARPATHKDRKGYGDKNAHKPYTSHADQNQKPPWE